MRRADCCCCSHVINAMPSWILRLITMLGVAMVTDSTQPVAPGTTTVCEGELFRAKCSTNEVIIMQSALYGRMRLGRCVKVDMGYLGCSADVLHLADGMCSGRQTCEIRVSGTTFPQPPSCLELKTYLEASYSCLPVHAFDVNQCRAGSKPGKVTGQLGYISSALPSGTGLQWNGCTSPTSWLIEVQPGQRINLTLYDFSVHQRNSDDKLDQSGACQVYAVLNEPGPPLKNSVLCGGKARLQQAYITSNNSLDIRIDNQKTNTQHFFVLKYEAIGCPDPRYSMDTWWRRDGDELKVGCTTTNDVWTVFCSGTEWTGVIGNCTHYEVVASSLLDVTTSHSDVVAGTICAIALVVGVLVLAIGIIIYRRYRHRTTTRAHMSPKVTEESCSIEEEPHSKHTSSRHDNHFSSCSRAGDHDNHFSVGSRSDLAGGGGGRRTADYRKATNCSTCGNKYTHIWEMPLPIPGEP